MAKRKIYMDHASTTYTLPEVVDAMLPYFTEKYGNAESAHQIGREAKEAIDNARETVAKYLNCRPDEIIFTGSATEANNLALKGVLEGCSNKGAELRGAPHLNHIITSKIEHSSILNTCKYLETKGIEVTYLDVDENGLVSPQQVEESITEKTALVSIMYANNEIGTIEPIQEIGEICKQKGVLFHTDAAQAAGVLTLDTKELNTNLLTITSSKFYGPKGTGILFIQKGTKIVPQTHGGSHEFGLRAGTQNTANIVGFAKALEIAQENMKQENTRLTKMRDNLIQGLTEKTGALLNGHLEKRLPNNINISIPEKNGSELTLYLDEAGICISTASACMVGKGNPSHVLTAIGIPPKLRNSTLRITIGKHTTDEDINYTIETLTNLVKKL